MIERARGKIEYRALDERAAQIDPQEPHRPPLTRLQTPRYDVFIRDLAPARGPVSATALVAATRCIAPVPSEVQAMRALQAIAESVGHAQRVNARLRPRSDSCGQAWQDLGSKRTE